MATLRIPSNSYIDYATDWAEFKKWIDGTYANLQYTWCEDDVSYTVIFQDGGLHRVCCFSKGTSDATNFETYFKTYITADVRTSDGKMVVMPSLFPGGVYFYTTGRGDDVESDPPERGTGTRFEAHLTSAGASSVTFQFMDWVYLAGGGLSFINCVQGDYISITIVAPASTVTPSAGGNTGNCNVVSGVIVPAAGNGAYNVDLTTAVPIPAFNDVTGVSSGYWDWSQPDTGFGTITASSTPGSAKWHLLAASRDLVRFINERAMLGSVENIVETFIKPKRILPQWQFRVDITSAGGEGHDAYVAWYVRCARAQTV